MRRFTVVLRSVGSVLSGYVFLALANMLFVMLWFVNPVAELSLTWILMLAIPYTLFTAGLGGFVTALIAVNKRKWYAAVVAALMGIVIVMSLIIDVAVEPAIYRWLYLFLMIPATVYGGILFEQRKNRQIKESA